MASKSEHDRNVPAIVLAVFLALTFLATGYVWSMSRRSDRARFQNATQATRDTIEARLDTYVNVLLATRAVFAADLGVTRDALRRYTRQLNVLQRYPGIEGIGFSMRLRPEDVARVAEEMKSEGVPDFHIWPRDPAREELHAIVLIEPMTDRNRVAVGYDMHSHPVRREAMDRARDTGLPVASGHVVLVQERDANKQPGFLIYVPVYTNGPTPSSVEERRERLLGFVYAPFRTNDLFTGVFRSQDRPEVGFTFVDQSGLLYQTEAPPVHPRFTSSEPVVIAGHTFTFHFFSRRSGYGPGLWYAGGTLCGGLIISFLLFSLIRVQLQARAEAEQASRAKDEFLATLSHELRTPMTAILGWSKMLGEEDLDDETRAIAIDAIRNSSQVQAQLIDDLLDVSRITAGKTRIDPKPIELAPIVTAAMDTMAVSAETKGVRIFADTPSTPVVVNGDARRLQQVIWNLLANAVKFTPPGGTVRVVLRADDREAIIEVRDSGQGIDPAFMPHMFERFRQADSSTTRSHAGLGLGLAIVQHLTELHAGRVEAESPGLGRGATFRVRLPLYRDLGYR